MRRPTAGTVARALTLGAVVSCFLAGSAPAQTPPGSPSVGPAGAAAVPGASLEPPAGALVPVGPSPDVDLLYTGDVIGYVDPCG